MRLPSLSWAVQADTQPEVFLAVICQHREFQSQIGNGQNPINGIASQGIGVEGIIIGLGIFPVQTLLGQSQQMGGILFCLTLLPQVAEGKAQGSQQQTASQDHTDPFPEGIIPAERVHGPSSFGTSPG